jgi:hypothetical protein
VTHPLSRVRLATQKSEITRDIGGLALRPAPGWIEIAGTGTNGTWGITNSPNYKTPEISGSVQLLNLLLPAVSGTSGTNYTKLVWGGGGFLKERHIPCVLEDGIAACRDASGVRAWKTQKDDIAAVFIDTDDKNTLSGVMHLFRKGVLTAELALATNTTKDVYIGLLMLSKKPNPAVGPNGTQTQ